MRSLRAPVTLALIVAFPLVFAAGLVALTVWSWSTDTTWATYVTTGLLVGFVAAIVGGLRSPQPAPEGVPLTREAQPVLWREIDDLADRLGATRPESLTTLHAPSAGGARTRSGWGLVLGYPLLVRMTAGELRSVMAHTIARYRTVREPGVGALLAVHERLERIYDQGSGPLGWLLWPLRWFHAAAIGFVERQWGEEADRLAAAMTTPHTAASALRRATELEVMWDTFESEYVSLFPSVGRRASIAEGLRLLEDAARPDLAAAADEALAAEEPGWWDANTTTAERIASLTELPDAGLPDDTRPALALWTGGPAALLALEGELFVEPLPVTNWDELVRDGVPLATRQAMAGLAAAIALPGVPDDAPPASYGQLFNELARPAGGALGQLQREASEEPDDEDPADLLAALVRCALFESGAQARVRWDAAPDVVDHDGSRIDVGSLTADAVGSADRVGALAELLERRGLDLARTPGEDAPEPLPECLVVATLLKLDGKGSYDAFVWTSGILLVPSGATLGRTMLGDQSVARQSERVDEVLSRPLAEMQAAPGTRWIPREAVLAWRSTLVPVVATHLRTDEGDLELRPTSESQGLAEIDAALEGIVGPPTRRRDWGPRP